MKYAQQTDVPAGRSRDQIERVLVKYGASRFMYGWEEGYACVAFEMHGHHIKFLLPMPSPTQAGILMTPTGRKRTQKQVNEAYEQACRQRWRALHLVIKAKLEAIESGIRTFEQEFLDAIVTEDGSTVGDRVIPEVRSLKQGKPLPQLKIKNDD